MVDIVVKLMAVLILTGVRFADLTSGLSDDEELYIFQELENQDEDSVRQQERNQDLPHRCRSDICAAYQSFEPRRGRVNWPDAYLGTRVLARCAYLAENDTQVAYASNDCTLNSLPWDPNTTEIWWTGLDNSQCPVHPFVVLLREMAEEVALEKVNPNAGSEGYGLPLSWYTEKLEQAVVALHMFEDVVVFEVDCTNWILFMEYKVDVYHANQAFLSPKHANMTVLISSFMLESRMQGFPIFGSMELKTKFIHSLQHLGNVMRPGVSTSKEILLQNDYVFLDDIAAGVRLRGTFEGGVPQTPEITAIFSPSWGERSSMYTSTILVLKDAEFLQEETQIYDISMEYYPPIPTTLPPLYEYINGTLRPMAPESGENREPLQEFPSFQVEKVPKFSYNIYGPLVHVSFLQHYYGKISNDTDPTRPANIYTDVYAVFKSVTDERDADSTVCGAALETDLEREGLHKFEPLPDQPLSGGALDEWTQSREKPVLLTDDSSFCHYVGVGTFALFAKPSDIGGVGGTTFLPPYNTDPPIDPLLSFLGFPYMHDLYIVGHVLRGLSCVGLLLTILSFTLFKHARRGIPTKILLNLCVSLTGLLVILYITEFIGGERHVGCTASGILRYYFIMTSLLWNGVEGVTMYIMLVKVMNSHIHRFMLKTSVFAWGIPVLMIAIALIVDKHIFDGYFDDECIFRCEIYGDMLHYGYLLPLGLIILHNIIIFCVVLRIIRKQGSPTPDNSGNGRETSSMSQLAGAVSMLVLLGVPWVFSAFGVIDDIDVDAVKLTEGIFQAVFVVLVNFQGIYIFLFYCVRSSDVRGQWTSLLSSSPSSDTSLPHSNKPSEKSTAAE